MIRPRLIPCLLIHDKGLVKTVRFSDPKYVGDPLNAVRIFNEKEVDEIFILDMGEPVRIWDLASGQAVALHGHWKVVDSLCFGPDGRHLLSARSRRSKWKATLRCSFSRAGTSLSLTKPRECSNRVWLSQITKVISQTLLF